MEERTRREDGAPIYLDRKTSIIIIIRRFKLHMIYVVMAIRVRIGKFCRTKIPLGEVSFNRQV